MTRVVYERRTIGEAVTGQPFTRRDMQFRSGLVAMLFVAFVQVLGPGSDYERATFA